MQKCIEFGSELSHGNSLVIRSIGHYLCNLGPVANSRGSARYEQESGHRGPRDLTGQEGQLPGQRTKQGKGPVQAGIGGEGGRDGRMFSARGDAGSVSFVEPGSRWDPSGLMFQRTVGGNGGSARSLTAQSTSCL